MTVPRHSRIVRVKLHHPRDPAMIPNARRRATISCSFACCSATAWPRPAPSEPCRESRPRGPGRPQALRLSRPGSRPAPRRRGPRARPPCGSSRPRGRAPGQGTPPRGPVPTVCAARAVRSRSARSARQKPAPPPSTPSRTAAASPSVRRFARRSPSSRTRAFGRFELRLVRAVLYAGEVVPDGIRHLARVAGSCGLRRHEAALGELHDLRVGTAPLETCARRRRVTVDRLAHDFARRCCRRRAAARSGSP